MSATTSSRDSAAALHQPVGDVGERIWERWSSDTPTAWARGLALAGMAFLFLDAAATFEAVYTLRVSYVLFVAACAVGAPAVVTGWLRLPSLMKWLAGFLLVTYLLATVTGQAEGLAGQPRAGAERELVYISDLILGLALVGLVAGLWPQVRQLRPAFVALSAGATAAAAYAVYQWFAQHFGWPLSDVNNALNTNGVTRGSDYFIGTGLMGWQRSRGTFAEPHHLGAYLAMMLPIVLGLTVMVRDRPRGPLLTRLLLASAMLIGAGMLVTSSFPAWATAALGILVSLALVAVAAGRPARAFLAGVAAACALLVGPLTLFSPQTVTPLTGRTSLELPTEYRTGSWEAAVRSWASRPILGYGPGQSAVRLAGASRSRAEATQAPTVLGSASGIWAASLVDAGIIGFGAWIAFLGAILVIGASSLLRRPTVILWATFCAGVVAVTNSLVVADRVELRVWVILALLAAAASSSARSGSGGSDAGGPDREPERGTA